MIIMKPICTAIFAFFLLMTPALAQNKAQQIDVLLQKYHNYGQLNGAVLVAKGDDVIYKMGFGKANMEWDIPNTPDTKFRIGSVGKQFTAALILQLVEAGNIDLQGKITDYLPDYPKTQGNRITIHHLLTHSSGIPDLFALPNNDEFAWKPYEPELFLTEFSSLDLEFEPGTQWNYSNSGYYVLGVIIEKITGNAYDEVLQTSLLEHLGLEDTGYDHFSEIIEHRATGYVYDKALGIYQNAAYIESSTVYAAGMLYSTVEDLFKWTRALHSGKPFRQLTTLKNMATPHMQIYEYGNYGYGLTMRAFPLSNKSVRLIGHEGDINGFSCTLYYLPDQQYTIVVLDNTERPSARIAEAVFHVLYDQPAPEPKRSIADVISEVITGSSVGEGKIRYRELKETQPDVYDFSVSELERLGNNYLINGDIDTAIEIFKLNLESYPEASSNIYENLGEAYMEAGSRELAIMNYRKALELNPASENSKKILSRLGIEVKEVDIKVPIELLASFVGKYEFQPNFVIAVIQEGDQMYTQATNQRRYEIFPMAENKFYIKLFNAQFTFHRSVGGEVESMTLHQNSRNIMGKKIE